MPAEFAVLLSFWLHELEEKKGHESRYSASSPIPASRRPLRGSWQAGTSADSTSALSTQTAVCSKAQQMPSSTGSSVEAADWEQKYSLK